MSEKINKKVSFVEIFKEKRGTDLGLFFECSSPLTKMRFSKEVFDIFDNVVFPVNSLPKSWYAPVLEEGSENYSKLENVIDRIRDFSHLQEWEAVLIRKECEGWFGKKYEGFPYNSYSFNSIKEFLMSFCIGNADDNELLVYQFLNYSLTRKELEDVELMLLNEKMCSGDSSSVFSSYKYEEIKKCMESIFHKYLSERTNLE